MMLTNWIRIIRKDNLTYTDQSLLNDSESSNLTLDIVATDDALYIGKTYPFNNFFIWSAVANDQASDMVISYWSNNQWITAVDLLDGTKSGANTLATSGVVQFSPKQANTWTIVDDTSTVSGNNPTDLNSFTIYKLYWLKITFTANLKATTAIKRIFYNFTNQEVLQGLDADTSNYLSAFTGQTDFTKQMFLASKQTLISLKANKLALNEGNVLRMEDVYLSTSWRALALIYYSLGPDYTLKRTEALKMAVESLDLDNFSIDQDQDAFLDSLEIDDSSGGITRI